MNGRKGLTRGRRAAGRRGARAEQRYLRDLAIQLPRLRIRDWFLEAYLSVMRHPGRSLMTAIGTILGAAGFVATLGISSTMSWQVSDSFDLRRATEVRVVADQNAARAGWYSGDRLTRFRQLNGVVAAGRRVLLPELPLASQVGLPPEQVKVTGADPGAISVIAPHLVVGRTPDAYHEETSSPVALVAQTIAKELNLSGVGSAVFIRDRAYTVIGIFDDVERRPESLLSVIIPASVADGLAGPDQEAVRDVIVETSAGAAQLIGGQAPLALWPEAPEQLRAIAPPDPRTLRREVEASVTRSSITLSVIVLAIGAVSIANAATASITARTTEIGLRRAVGARRVHVFAQLLGETTALGALGGLVGVLFGIATTAVVSMVNSWTPVLDLRATLVAVGATTAIGLLAGLWPALKATRIQPVAALQR